MGTACRPSAPDCLAHCSSLPVLLALLAGPPPAIADTTGGARVRRGEPGAGAHAGPDAGRDVNPGGIDPSQPLPTPAPTLRRRFPRRSPATSRACCRAASRSRPPARPPSIQQIIAAGNRIAQKQYIWGGGHRRWEDRGYDCSGSVSYALHGAGLLDAPLVSGELGRWGDAGPGRWVTIYANAGHVYMIVAGLRFDTSGPAQAGTPLAGRAALEPRLPRAAPRRALSASTVRVAAPIAYRERA